MKLTALVFLLAIAGCQNGDPLPEVDPSLPLEPLNDLPAAAVNAQAVIPFTPLVEPPK